MAIGTEFSWREGLVPPFRTASRDRGSVALDAAAHLGPVEIGVRGDFLRDVSGVGEVIAGPGDLRLGTVVSTPTWRGLGGSVGWEAKLPDATDEGELGSDETDIILGVGGRWSSGPWWVGAGLGLAILGNPLKFANQDDVPLVRAEGGWRAPRWAVDAGLLADLGTSRNPARVEAEVHGEHGDRVVVRLGARAGLTPAAPDWGAEAAVVARFPFRARPPLSEPGPGG